MSNIKEFRKWISDQKAQGLVDMRLSHPFGVITPEVKERIRADILDAEKAISEGRFREPPMPK